ncbi:nitroreductase family protein [Peribacillus kribbensis]|uniref:nitroreductase family protein n=1 Tax=Peribacillus kribbensis TaxID=356658 RepID=UPI00041FD875|nr:nitroreductase family protein [Peribacillus kribbensis]
MSNLINIIEERRSVKVYDPNVEISRSELSELLALAGRAPSAWNLQHWHFMVFSSKESKQKLFPLAFNQAQIVESSAVIAVLGDKEVQKKVEPVFGPDVEAGRMSPEVKDVLAGQVNRAYQNKEKALTAAYLNASLAAMQLMLAAKAKGWDTCPIGGFNSSGLIEEFEIESRYEPIMLITIGKALQPGRETTRLDVKTISTWL